MGDTNETKPTAKRQPKKRKSQAGSSRTARGGTRRASNRTLTIVVPHYSGHLTRVHKSSGQRSGLGICEFVAILLKQNELNPRHLKMTDHVMEQRIVDEFPQRAIVKRMIEDCNGTAKEKRKHKITMLYWRSQYNGGRLSHGGVKPEVRSQRYDERGNVIKSLARGI